MAILISDPIHEMDLNRGILRTDAVDVADPVRSVRKMDTIGIESNLFKDRPREPVIRRAIPVHRVRPSRGNYECPVGVQYPRPPGKARIRANSSPSTGPHGLERIDIVHLEDLSSNPSGETLFGVRTVVRQDPEERV